MLLIDTMKFNGFIGMFGILLNLINANLISPETKAKMPFEENADNNGKDDSHLRLYYKSNSPGQSISHELEHRYVKSPNYKFTEDTTNFRPGSNFVQNSAFSQAANDQPNIFLDSNDKNKQTMLNLHYHGNSFPESDPQQQANYPNMRSQASSSRKNLIKMLLMNFSPSSNSFYPQDQPLTQSQQQQPQARFQFNPVQFDSFSNQQTKSQDGLQYKIVHLKFKIQPQLGRVIGQGFVETDNGAGSILNARRFSLMPREVPDLVKSLLMSTQQRSISPNTFPFMENFHMTRTSNLGNLNKREEASDSYSEEASSNYERRDDSNDDIKMGEILGSSKNSDNERGRRFKKIENKHENDEIKIENSDGEEEEKDVNKLKSLKRRDDIEDEYSSLSERSDSENDFPINDDTEKKMLLRNDDDSISDE